MHIHIMLNCVNNHERALAKALRIMLLLPNPSLPAYLTSEDEDFFHNFYTKINHVSYVVHFCLRVGKLSLSKVTILMSTRSHCLVFFC